MEFNPGIRGKSEIRISKSETSSKAQKGEIEKRPKKDGRSFSAIRISNLFRISIFGFRYSDFEFSFSGFMPKKAKAPRPGWAHGAKN